MHEQVGTVDLQPRHGLACLVDHHGETIVQAGSQRAGRQLEIARAFDHAQQLGQPHALQPEFAARGDGIQPDVALPFEGAALLGQPGGDQIITAIFGQGGQTVKLDAERFQPHDERLAHAIGVAVGEVAFVDPDVVDQHPRDRVGGRLLVFLKLGDQCSPVKLAAAPHLDGGMRLIELNIPNAPGPAE